MTKSPCTGGGVPSVHVGIRGGAVTVRPFSPRIEPIHKSPKNFSPGKSSIFGRSHAQKRGACPYPQTGKDFLAMSSPKQIEANRANSLLSTGPTSPAGKAKASHNAVNTGLTGRTV